MEPAGDMTQAALWASPQPPFTTRALRFSHAAQPPTAVKRERQRREQEIAQREAIRGMKMGAKDRSYLIRDGEIDVLRNVYGGVEVWSGWMRLWSVLACMLCTIVQV